MSTFIVAILICGVFTIVNFLCDEYVKKCREEVIGLRIRNSGQGKYIEHLENQIKDAEKGIGIESIKVVIKDLREDELFTTARPQGIHSPTSSFGVKAVIGGKIYGNFCYVCDENPSLKDIEDTINAQLEEMVESINGGHYDGT